MDPFETQAPVTIAPAKRTAPSRWRTFNPDFAPTTDDIPESEADFEPHQRSARAEPEWSECSLLHESTEDHGPSPAR
ncbi:MAG: hypothetical protein JW751_14890, partial [Polyangiaceae bacterium]|nr:hypothetical protein [Polyangiaceae bacterium]